MPTNLRPIPERSQATEPSLAAFAQSGPADAADGAGLLPNTWQWLRSAPTSAVTNMAVDLALLARAQTEPHGVWRCYAWERPAISFGRNEAVRGRFDADSVRTAGLDVVRRPTGGRALLHAREVTYSVTLPLPAVVPWRQAYDAVNHLLLRALHRLGVPAVLVGDDATEATRPDGPLCFARPAAGELTLEGAKLVGSAVWREGGAYLQHGSILLHDDQPRLFEAMCPGSPPSPSEQPTSERGPSTAALALPPAANLSAWSARAGTATPDFDDVADALQQTLRDAWPAHGALEPFDASAPSFLDHVQRAERDLARADWLWRR